MQAPTPEQILKKYWGYDAFRPLQREIIGSALDGRDTLALLPTGGGKSLCYQVPALVLPGMCVVVSPLIALMQDQVDRLVAMGVDAACIHSGMRYNQVQELLTDAVEGAYKLLYVSPERLQTRGFRDFLDNMDISLLAVDEAHCISQWGHDFRPAYTRIAEVRDLFPSLPVLALTASATPDVQSDIQQQLKMQDPAVFRQSFARPNINYEVRYSERKNTDTLENVGNGTGIIYCRSRKLTEAVGTYLDQNGVPAAVYHAGLGREKREEAQQLWMTGKVGTMVATTAFGMGIDKADVRTVVHYDSPEHLEAYYQEAGRAGRDGAPSVALTLFNNADIFRLRESADIQFPPEDYLRKVYQAVAEYLQVPISAQPDRYFPFDLSEFCHRFGFQLGRVIYALKLLERQGLWTLTDSVYNPATLMFTADRYVLDSIKQMNPTLDYVIVGLLRMYNSIFHFPTAVREMAIARQLRMRRDELIACLEKLDAMGVLEYNKPSDGPQLLFHHYRVDARHLIIDTRHIAMLRKRHEARTDAMIGFLENKDVCREKILLEYFGETPQESCGHCDVCRKKTAVPLNKEALSKALLAAVQHEGRIGIDRLVAAYPDRKEEVIHALRTLADKGTVIIEGSVVRLPGRI
jgi:ATP-dependent DNA helicase RecQ